MVDATLIVMKIVKRAKWVVSIPPSVLPAFSLLLSRSRFVAEVQYRGPALLEMKDKKPTAATLNDEMPLYADERSIEEMEFEPPKAKKVAY